MLPEESETSMVPGPKVNMFCREQSLHWCEFRQTGCAVTFMSQPALENKKQFIGGCLYNSTLSIINGVSVLLCKPSRAAANHGRGITDTTALRTLCWPLRRQQGLCLKQLSVCRLRWRRAESLPWSSHRGMARCYRSSAEDQVMRRSLPMTYRQNHQGSVGASWVLEGSHSRSNPETEYSKGSGVGTGNRDQRDSPSTSPWGQATSVKNKSQGQWLSVCLSIGLRPNCKDLYSGCSGCYYF